MDAELPQTAAMRIYGVDLVVELLGGHESVTRALVEDAITTAAIYAGTLAVTYLRGLGEQLPIPPAGSLFDHRVRKYVDALLTSTPEADVAAGVLLRHGPGSEFHRDEVTRWARVVGLLAQLAAGEPAAPGLLERRMQALESLVAGLEPDKRPATSEGYRLLLQQQYRGLFDLTQQSFDKHFWHKPGRSDIVDLS